MKEVIWFAETELGMEECVTTYAKVNTSSANVLHKLGFIDEAEIPYECSGGDIITGGKMKTVKEVSMITGVSIRTLRYYDEIGLLRPTELTEAGYRLYDNKALEKLQEILFFREYLSYGFTKIHVWK